MAQLLFAKNRKGTFPADAFFPRFFFSSSSVLLAKTFFLGKYFSEY